MPTSTGHSPRNAVDVLLGLGGKLLLKVLSSSTGHLPHSNDMIFCLTDKIGVGVPGSRDSFDDNARENEVFFSLLEARDSDDDDDGKGSRSIRVAITDEVSPQRGLQRNRRRRHEPKYNQGPSIGRFSEKNLRAQRTHL